MSNFKKKLFTDIAIGAGAVLIFSIGILFFGSRVSADAEKIAKTRKDVSDGAASVESYSLVKSQYNGEAREYMEVIKKAIPLKDELINLRKDFQYLATSENLDMTFSFLGEQGTSIPQLGSVGVSLTVQGDLATIGGFLKKLDGFRYLMGVENLTFDNREGKSNASLRAKVFFRK